MRLMKRFSALLLIGLVSLTVLGEKHPNIELGFNPDRLYQFGDLDSVNLFNGNLIIQIPIGDAYYANADFGYRLGLTYNAKVWDYRRYEVSQDSYVYAEPNWRSNAGVGWRVSLGRLLPPTTTSASSPWTDSAAWTYESATGEEHSFMPPDGTTPSDLTPLMLSTDQSRLRMIRQSATRRDIEFPNGDVHEFDQERGRWHLRRISDRFGNHLSIETQWVSQNITSDGREAAWVLTDYDKLNATIRTHRVEFLPSSSAAGGSLEINDSYDQGQVVSSIKLAKVGGGVSEYRFEYTATDVQWGCGHHPNPSDSDPTFKTDKATLPMLSRIVLPDEEQTAFAFSYYTVGAVDTPAGQCGQGMLQTMELPTRGKTTYQYQQYNLPESVCNDAAYEFINPGVKTKSTSDGRTWDYVLTLGPEVDLTTQEAYTLRTGCGGTTEAPGFPSAPVTIQPPRRWSRTTVLSPSVDYVASNGSVTSGRVRNDSYFYVWTTSRVPDSFTSTAETDTPAFGQAATTGAPSAAQSMTLTCSVSGGCPDVAAADDSDPATRRRLSTRLFEGCTSTGDCTAGRLLRSTFLRFGTTAAIAAPNAAAFHVYPPVSSRTVAHDDLGCSGGCATTTWNDLPNGLGDYGRTTASSNYPGNIDVVTTTAYKAWTAAMIASSSEPWILGTYDSVTRQQATSKSTTEFCFEPATGFLSGVRVRATDAVRGADDVLTIYNHDTFGNMVTENLYTGAATTAACPTMSSAPQYSLSHQYAFGRRKKSEYCKFAAGGCDSVLTIFDVSTDNSGTPLSSRDVSGAQTLYGYDSWGRLKKISPPSTLASSDYTYSVALRSSNGTITRNPTVTEALKDGTTTLSSNVYEFDSFGRPWRVSKSLANGKVAVVETIYDGMGRKSSTSQPYEQNSHPQGVTPLASRKTVTVYDGLGRPVKVTAPDQGLTEFAYTGDRVVTRTVRIATTTNGAAAATPATTTETYDAQHRLIKVEEAASATSVTSPTGGLVTTNYEYDVAGRLTKVVMTGGGTTQERSFTYDGRGFLIGETHPETSSVTYGDYDARGHARTRTDGNGTITTTFDFAERPLTIASSTGTVKEFTYGTGATSDDLKGKLKTAHRRNDLGGGLQVDVTETYSYLTSTGQLASRKTLVERVAGTTRTPIKEFDYGVDAYDRLGQPATIRMPSCTQNGCTAAAGLATVSFARNAGYLTSVVNFGSLTYSPAGMVTSVMHLSTPSAVDSYLADANGLARPAKITFGGGSASTCPAPAASTIAAPPSLCQSATGTASVPVRAGITHTWQITNGTILTHPTPESITFQSNGTGSVVLTVTATSESCGLATNSSVTIATSTPPASETIDAPVCVDTTGTASVPALTGITHVWQITNGTITSSTTGEVITFTPSGAGVVTLTVVATNACSAGVTTTKTVAFGCSTGLQPATIQAPARICGRAIGDASVPAETGITHTWTITGGLLRSPSTGDSISFFANPSGTVTLTVTSTNASGSVASSVDIPIDWSPIVTLSVPTTLPIVRGATAQVKVSFEGTGPWHLVWADNTTEDVNVNPYYRTVSPTTTYSYDLVEVTSPASTCPLFITGSGQVLVIPAAPAWVRAQRSSDGSVNVTWATVPGASSYYVERLALITGAPQWNAYTSTQPIVQAIATGTPVTYIYRIRTKDSAGMLSSPAMDYTTTATTLWSQPATAGSLVRAVDIQELRKAVDAFRVAYGQPAAFGSSVAPAGAVTSANLLALMTALNQARASRLGEFIYAGVPAPKPGDRILAQHILQLRVALD